MSKFSRFMKENKKERKNGFYTPTESLTDEKGNPLEWEFRHITAEENEKIRDEATVDVQVTGKPNMFRPRVNTAKYMVKMIAKATVTPDLYDKDLQDSYGAMTPEELVYAMVDDAGEYQELSVWMQQFQGFTKGFDEKVEEAKN